MKKLLQINVIANSFSTGRIAEGIGLSAMNAGWDSYIAYGRWANPSHSKLIKIGNNLDYYNHYIQTRLFDNHGLASKNSTRKFLDAVDIIRPDIVHLHNIHGYYINYDILFDYLAQKGIPVVWTLHDCWSFTGHCTYFDSVNCEQWKEGCQRCSHQYLYPKSIFINRSSVNFQKKQRAFTMPKSMTIVPVSYWLGNYISESFLNNYPLRVIHNGIDVDVFNAADDDEIRKMRDKYGLNNSEKIVLGVANGFGPRKGYEDFIKLSKNLFKQYRIVLVGLNKKQLTNLPANIIGIERTEDIHQLAILYSAACFYVNPTYEDNYPTTNMEAIACGTPVITYKTGGSPESVSKETGFILDKGDLSGVINIINNNTDLKIHCQNKCREFAVSYFDKRQCFQRYIDLYEELLK